MKIELSHFKSRIETENRRIQSRSLFEDRNFNILIRLYSILNRGLKLRGYNIEYDDFVDYMYRVNKQ